MKVGLADIQNTPFRPKFLMRRSRGIIRLHREIVEAPDSKLNLVPVQHRESSMADLKRPRGKRRLIGFTACSTRVLTVISVLSAHFLFFLTGAAATTVYDLTHSFTETMPVTDVPLEVSLVKQDEGNGLM